jgi:hypothetical protein
MTSLLDRPPYADRDDDTLLAELVALTRRHLDGCAAYRAVWPGWHDATTFAELPYLHVSGFKHVDYRTDAPEVRHQRTLTSSSTTGASPSRIVLDEQSSVLQSASTLAILRDFVGDAVRPLVVLDDPRSLRRRGEVGARIAAAMSLKPLASDLRFAISSFDPPVVDWDAVAASLDLADELLVYGFTWILWQSWGAADVPAAVADRLARTRVHFVHSGGWKRLEAQKVDRATFDGALLAPCGPGSKVVDYYGLVEQVGVVYPLCDAGARHAPRWSMVVVRDPWTGAPTTGDGLLQLMNPLALGAPYHSVLTEDLGRLLPGPCPCGRPGPRFELLGRVPRAEVRGCADA